MAGFAQFISKEGLVNLQNYKYRGGVYTPLDNAMQPFWNWFVTLIPMVTIASNHLVGGAKPHYIHRFTMYCSYCAHVPTL
jgi:hypothetical protein